MKTTPKFKPVDPRITQHPIEKRGFVTVPFDYANTSGSTIDLFYRLIPAYGSSPNDSSKPIIVVINGGPGIASSVYRPLDFDYSDPSSPKNGILDRFKFLLKTHHVLIVDQRGTAGQSAPIDMDDPNLNAEWVAQYFSSDSHARDYLAVIEDVIHPRIPFIIIAQSYGGMPGMQYLSLPHARRPQGIIFSSSALPYESTIDQMLSRRREQLALNQQLKAVIPDIELHIKNASNHLERLGLGPDRIHGLFMWLGKGESGVWEPELLARLKKILTQDRHAIENHPHEKFGEVSLLNYILSSVNFTVGYTDRTLARMSSERIPFEPWMIDENKMLMTIGSDGSWREAFLDQLDKNPPPGTPFASVEKLRDAIGQNQVLFTAADNDAFVPADIFMKASEKFMVPGHTEVRRLPGGHNAIFLEKGHEAILDWSSECTQPAQ